MDALDKLTRRFYDDVKNAVIDDAERARRQEVFDDIDEVLQQKESENEYLVVKRADDGETGSKKFRVYTHDPTAQVGERDRPLGFYKAFDDGELFGGEFSAVSTTSSSPKTKKRKRTAPAVVHQGFNERSGIRRWMLDGGIRYEQRRKGKAEEAVQALEDFNEFAEDFEIMQHDVSIGSLRPTLNRP